MRRAVIDVGSNSLLLLVSEFRDGQWHSIFESTAVTALGEGTKATGLLGERGLEASLVALREMWAAAGEYGATPRAAATMAVRIAANADEFLAKAIQQGTPVSVLSGDEEAQLGFEAIASDPIFANHSRISIIDPGGQSTELLTADRNGTGWEVLYRKSYPVGTLGLKTEVLRDESPQVSALLVAVAYIDDLIGMAYRPNEGGHAIVLGATGTNLVSIREQLAFWQPERVHGAYLDYEEISKAVGWMMPMTDAERAAIPGLQRGREKTIHLGAMILERFLFALRVLGCSVSVRGWRHAYLERD